MKLYLLRPRDVFRDYEHRNYARERGVNPWEPWYDKVFGLVVRAEDESLARTWAATEAGDEGEQAWLDPRYSSCTELTADGPDEVVMVDNHAA